MIRSYWYPAAVGNRLSIVIGVVAGAFVSAGVLVGVLAFAPDPAPVSGGSPSPGVSATAGADPSASSAPSDSPAASGARATATLIVTSFHVGEPAPPIKVPQLGGGEIDLAALKGQPVWVNIMATWCPSCVDEFPLMNSFAARYAANGLVVLAIDVREDEGTVASFARRLEPIFPMGLDTDGAVAEAWDAIALPMHFWVDVDGIVSYGAVGGIGPDEMARGLRTILPGVEVTP